MGGKVVVSAQFKPATGVNQLPAVAQLAVQAAPLQQIESTLRFSCTCVAFTPESVAVLEQRRSEFARRRDFLLPRLRSAGLSVPAEPHGAFYIYADCRRDAREYCLQLLEKEAVAATPGVDFGANGTERYVRFAYTRSMGDLEEAAVRIRRFAASLPSA